MFKIWPDYKKIRLDKPVLKRLFKGTMLYKRNKQACECSFTQTCLAHFILLFCYFVACMGIKDNTAFIDIQVKFQAHIVVL